MKLKKFRVTNFRSVVESSWIDATDVTALIGENEADNAIVPLDEPGHPLHPLAQRDLSAFFDNLSKTHQIVFTTPLAFYDRCRPS